MPAPPLFNPTCTWCRGGSRCSSFLQTDETKPKQAALHFKELERVTDGQRKAEREMGGWDTNGGGEQRPPSPQLHHSPPNLMAPMGTDVKQVTKRHRWHLLSPALKRTVCSGLGWDEVKLSEWMSGVKELESGTTFNLSIVESLTQDQLPSQLNICEFSTNTPSLAGLQMCSVTAAINSTVDTLTSPDYLNKQNGKAKNKTGKLKLQWTVCWLSVYRRYTVFINHMDYGMKSLMTKTSVSRDTCL